MNTQSIDFQRARKNFPEILERVTNGYERLTITRHGKAVAAIVPADDLALLKRFEEELDRSAIDEALAEQGNDPYENWEDVKKELDL